MFEFCNVPYSQRRWALPASGVTREGIEIQAVGLCLALVMVVFFIGKTLLTPLVTSSSSTIPAAPVEFVDQEIGGATVEPTAAPVSPSAPLAPLSGPSLSPAPSAPLSIEFSDIAPIAAMIGAACILAGVAGCLLCPSPLPPSLHLPSLPARERVVAA